MIDSHGPENGDRKVYIRYQGTGNVVLSHTNGEEGNEMRYMTGRHNNMVTGHTELEMRV